MPPRRPAARSTESETVIIVPRAPSKLGRNVMTLEKWRAQMLDAAGLSPADVEQSVQVLREAMSATNGAGAPDHGERRRAAREILELVGAFPSKSSIVPEAPEPPVVRPPSWAKTIDVEAEDATSAQPVEGTEP